MWRVGAGLTVDARDEASVIRLDSEFGNWIQDQKRLNEGAPVYELKEMSLKAGYQEQS